jgi:hypothetical protein
MEGKKDVPGGVIRKYVVFKVKKNLPQVDAESAGNTHREANLEPLFLRKQESSVFCKTLPVREIK